MTLSIVFDTETTHFQNNLISYSYDVYIIITLPKKFGFMKMFIGRDIAVSFFFVTVEKPFFHIISFSSMRHHSLRTQTRNIMIDLIDECMLMNEMHTNMLIYYIICDDNRFRWSIVKG